MNNSLQLSPRARHLVTSAALLALFLGALDALVMSAAMPTIVADLGGLHLYSWVFSAYLLSRTVCLPVVGKLCDLLDTKILFIISIALFVLGSVLAGISQSMTQLILARVLQGLGAGGNFGLCYFVLSVISPPHKRGKMMSLASFVWGVASVFGPTFGGFMVTYFSWRWIFLINLPLGMLCFAGIVWFLNISRVKRERIFIDYKGIFTLTAAIVALLLAFLLAGRDYPWLSAPIIGLIALSAAAGVAFYRVEKHAPEPVLSFDFFRIRGFSTANGAVFSASFAIFSLVSFSPLFIQGALAKTPAQLGLAMMSLSLAWSLGAMLYGQLSNRLGEKSAALLGALMLAAACGWTVTFDLQTTLTTCFICLGLAGLGMGMSSLSTLLIVQNSMESADLGVATSSHQFTRTLGGTIGIGIAGSLVTARFSAALDGPLTKGPVEGLADLLSGPIHQNLEVLFRPEVQSLLPFSTRQVLQDAVGHGAMAAFWTAFGSALLCLMVSALLPGRKG